MDVQETGGEAEQSCGNTSSQAQHGFGPVRA